MIDFNALVAPINDSTNTKTARSAVWAVLRTVKYGAFPVCRMTVQDRRNVIAAIDAAAWQAGLSVDFRQHALGACYDGLGPFTGCIPNCELEPFPIIPELLEPLCLT